MGKIFASINHQPAATISDFSVDVTIGTTGRCPSGETSKPTLECIAALASVPMVNFARGIGEMDVDETLALRRSSPTNTPFATNYELNGDVWRSIWPEIQG